MKKNLLKTLVIIPLSFNLCSVSAYAENKIEDTTYNTISFSSELETRTKNINGEEMSSSNITTAALKSKFIYMFKIFLISTLIFQKIKKISLSLFFKKYRTSCFSSS